jgi:hypothetical protein
MYQPTLFFYSMDMLKVCILLIYEGFYDPIHGHYLLTVVDYRGLQKPLA